MPESRNNKPVRAATLADVGRAAGVSAMAVSAVLNGAKTTSRISAETRERIREAAATLCYRPNAAARALAKRRMDTLGVATVIREANLSQYFFEVFHGIMEAASRHNQNVTVFAVHDWGRAAERLTEFCDGRIDGLVLIAPKLTREAAKLLPAHTPFVALHSNEELPNVVNIETDEERGAYDLVSHLIARGHRRILHFAGPVHLIGAQRRVRGYRRALASASIRVQEDLVVRDCLDQAHGRDALRLWLRQHAGRALPEALFCFNDSVAIGCIEALAEIGLHVPGDLSVVGFDDTLTALTTTPQLTTMHQPLRAMGRCAVETLLARIVQQNGSGRVVSLDPVVFPVELVSRASVGPPPVAARMVPPTRILG